MRSNRIERWDTKVSMKMVNKTKSRRGMLIASGTVSGLGAMLGLIPQNAAEASTTATKEIALSKATKKPTTTKKPAKKATKAVTPTPTPSTSTTPSPTPSSTPSTSSKSSVNGTFTGQSYEALEGGMRSWGTVTVTITVSNGKITAAQGIQNPPSRGQQPFDQLVSPYVVAGKITIETLKSKPANQLPYVQGATYSTFAYWSSLQSAIKKAGL